MFARRLTKAEEKEIFFWTLFELFSALFYPSCHNPFLGYSSIHIFSSLLKKNIIQKNKKNIIKKYNSEKRMPKRSENSQNLVGEV
jgi:hypothetical protein